jgi:hypothetical protein
MSVIRSSLYPRGHADMLTLIHTFKLNSVDCQTWLADVLPQIASMTGPRLRCHCADDDSEALWRSGQDQLPGFRDLTVVNLLRAGELRAICVLDTVHEAVRDLTRARFSCHVPCPEVQRNCNPICDACNGAAARPVLAPAPVPSSGIWSGFSWRDDYFRAGAVSGRYAGRPSRHGLNVSDAGDARPPMVG